MEKLSLKEIANAVGCPDDAFYENIYIENITTDSRKIGKSSLFVAIKGENMDGHDYIDDFYKNGGIAAISENQTQSKYTLHVKNTVKAMGDIARLYRIKFNIPIIGITGSVGKTSTREMITSVFSQAGNTHATIKNFNNEIGLPQTLFELNNSHKFAVIEMGMNHSGEINTLTNITKPTIAVITNIGTAHIGNLGSKENILKAKMEILEGLPPNGTVILNGDDNLLWGIKNKITYKTIWFGIENSDCDIKAKNITLHADKSEFMIDENAFLISAPGRHHIYNALCAFAVALENGLSIPQIKNGIEAFKTADMRQKIININGIRIIEDCYNANVESMKAALEVLGRGDKTGRRVAILGDMGELGNFAESAHKIIGDYVANNKTDLLITVGAHSKITAEQAKKRGTDTKILETNKEAVKFITNEIKKGDTILIKASRSAKFEEIANGIRQGIGNRE